MTQGRGQVAAGDQRTADAGAAILEQGGNAVDAAVAAQCAAFVVEPLLTTPFGGGIATIAGGDHKPSCFQFFAHAPGRGLSPDLDRSQWDFEGLGVTYGPADQVFHIGRVSVATPLLFPGLLQMHQTHGRLPMSQVVQPAIQLASQPVTVSRTMGIFLKILSPILAASNSVKQIFSPGGRLLCEGEIYHMEEMVSVFEALARGDSAWVQERLLAEFSPPRGLLTTEDFEAAAVIQSAPLHIQCAGCDIFLPPPPITGGVLVAFGLKLLDAVLAAGLSDVSVSSLLATMLVTQKARESHLNTLLHERPVDLARCEQVFLSESYIQQWFPTFEKALREGVSTLADAPPHLGSTTHISVIDDEGVACSITSSNGEGCGHVVPGTGAMANNFMGEEDLHPRGFHQVVGGHALTSMMCPIVVTEQGRSILALGTGGSNRIRTILLQVLARFLYGNRDIVRAVESPRFHYEGGAVYIEKKSPTRQLDETSWALLKALSEDIVPFEETNIFFGGVHVVGEAGSVGDQRRGGAVATTREKEQS